MKLKASCLKKKINKISKPLHRLIKIKREKIKSIIIVNEKKYVTTDLSNITKIIGKHYERIYGNKLNNVDKIDKFLEIHKSQSLTQEEIDNLHSFY